MNEKVRRSKQREIFSSGEGDSWFARNGNFPLSLLVVKDSEVREHINSATSILEIGCSDGRQLASLDNHENLRLVGVDPSREAIAAGQTRYPHLDLRVGTAEDLPLRPHERFDLVIFGFCLYLIDRHDLLAAMSLAWRALEVGGQIAVVDFDVQEPVTTPYIHHGGIRSLKAPYAEILRLTGAFSVEFHKRLFFAPLPAKQRRVGQTPGVMGDWVSVWILRETPLDGP
jgi:SAM-dependent methyltransferase